MSRGPSKFITERRRRVIDSSLSVLTDPTSEMTTEGLEGFILRAHYFGVTAKIDGTATVILWHRVAGPRTVRRHRLSCLESLVA
jgi:hypothetical protein